MARKTSFYYSFLVLPAEQRQAIVAVWDFCRAVDDAVDEEDAVEGGSRAGDAARREAVAFWRAELARAFDGSAPSTPQGQHLQPFIAAFDLPRQAFDDVIDGVAMDLDTARYETFADLYEYCRRVASAVGLICIRIFGCRNDRAREYAVNLGVALQLTNILRDIPDDLARGRVYLPLEDLAAHGCTVDDLAKGIVTEPVRRLMAFECARARDFYQRAILARPDEDRRRLVAAEIMRAVYFETLRRIERNGYDVFRGRVRVQRPTQAFIADPAAHRVVWSSGHLAGSTHGIHSVRHRRHRRRLRRIERSRASGRERRTRARARSAVEAGRPRDRIRRSRNRGARRQRSARADGLLHRDTGLSGRHRRDRQPPDRAAAERDDDRPGRDEDAAGVSGPARAAASGGRRVRVGRARLERSARGAADGRSASTRPARAHARRARDRGVARRDGRRVAGSQRTDRAPSGDVVGAAGAGRAEPIARPGGRAGLRARAGRDVRIGSAARGDSPAGQAPAPDVRGAGARVHRAARRHRANGRDREAGRRWRAGSRSVRRTVAPRCGDCRRAVVRASRVDRRRAGGARRHAAVGRPNGVVADRHGEPLVRSRGARRTVRRPARAARCSGCSTRAPCSAATRRVCLWCRAARHRSSR